ncbi:hypothetical protein FPV67DRAFT_1518841 [Lyophyllum atratum]|nr:hypothetical protein FPV67DRAFT_1518841 [Lyophyllum atratum]
MSSGTLPSPRQRLWRQPTHMRNGMDEDDEFVNAIGSGSSYPLPSLPLIRPPNQSSDTPTEPIETGTGLISFSEKVKRLSRMYPVVRSPSIKSPQQVNHYQLSVSAVPSISRSVRRRPAVYVCCICSLKYARTVPLPDGNTPTANTRIRHPCPLIRYSSMCLHSYLPSSTAQSLPRPHNSSATEKVASSRWLAFQSDSQRSAT